ncbi:MAG: hypothetical protein JW841_02340 [Deltaproteobacteria bacterium]|nr:hypothetical protein [Deltaproteobacteria bacterium]
MNSRTVRTIKSAPLGFALASIADNDERLEPIINQSPLSLEILWRSSCRLKPGDWLERLRLFTNGRCCFDGPALLRATTEVHHSDLGDGTLLALEVCSTDFQSELADIDVYSDPEIITDTIINLISANVLLTIERPDLKPNLSPITANICERCSAHHSATKGLVLKLCNSSLPTMRRGKSVALQSDVYGTRLILTTTYRARRGELIYLDWPELLRIWWRRSADRLLTDDVALACDLILPITGETAIRPINNLSATGVAINLAPSDALLVGIKIEHLSITLPDGSITAHGTVRNIHIDFDGSLIAGIELLPDDNRSRDLLRDFVQKQVRWYIHCARRKDLEELWPLWDALSLFSRGHAALTPGAAVIEAGRKALLDRGRDLMVAVVGTSEGSHQGTAEIIRTYSQTWTLQHLGKLPGSPLTSEQLIVAACEEALRHQNFGCLHALCEPRDDDPLLAAINRIQLSTAEVTQRPCALFKPIESLNFVPLRTDELHAPDADECDWLTTRLAAMHTKRELFALDLNLAELELSSISAAYRNIGLSRRRDLRIAIGVTGPNGFALFEHTSRGVSLTGYGDIARLYCIVSDQQSQMHTLSVLAKTAIALARSWSSSPLLLISKDYVSILQELGYLLIGQRIELLITREAVIRLVGHLRLHA